MGPTYKNKGHGTPAIRLWAGIEREQELLCSSVRSLIAEMLRDQRPWPLTLCGNAQSGKTATALLLIDKWGGSCENFHEWFALLASIRRGDTFTTRIDNTARPLSIDEYWRQWYEFPIVLLDEVAVERCTLPQIRDLHQALLVRSGHRTIITTRNTPDELLEILGQPIYSFLASGTIFAMPFKLFGMERDPHATI